MNKKQSLIYWALTLLMCAIIITPVYLINRDISRQPAPRIDDPFSLPYSVEIKNDHEVKLVSKYGTVTLYLENAYSLADETKIFIKHD